MSLLNRYEQLTPENKEAFGRMVIAFAEHGEELRKSIPGIALSGVPRTAYMEGFISTLEKPAFSSSEAA